MSKKIILALAAVVVSGIFAAVGYLLYAQADDAYWSGTCGSAEKSALFAADMIEGQIRAFPEGEGALAGRLTDGGLELNGAVYSPDAVVADAIGNNALTFFSMKEITGGAEEGETLYAVAAGDAGALRLIPAADYLSRAAGNAFSGALLLSESSRILAASGVPGEGMYLKDAFGLSYSALASGGEIAVGEMTCRAAVAEVSFGGTLDYVFAGLTDMTAARAALNVYRGRTLGILGVCYLGVMALVAFAFWPRKRDKELHAAAASVMTEPRSGFARRFLELADKGPILVGEIKLENIAVLRTMFGDEFSDAVQEVVSLRIAEVFPETYFLAGGFGVMSGGENLRTFVSDMDLRWRELTKPVCIGENLVVADLKAGFARIEDGGDFEKARACVKAALRRAEAECAPYFIYREEQKKHYARYMEKEIDIEKMLREDCFELKFQPQYSIGEKRIVGFEALFRAKRHLDADYNIQELINRAERTGKMIALGDFIFESGMKFAKSIEGRGATVSLNVSPVQLLQSGFVDRFLRLYKKYRLPRGSICVEITESFLMQAFDECVKKLCQLREAGIVSHLDDFGSTYSSMLYLKRLPVSAIKIDREFVKDLAENEHSRMICNTIVELSHKLGTFTIAEGVEDERQMELLGEMNCDVIQGYLTGRAMSAEEARKLL